MSTLSTDSAPPLYGYQRHCLYWRDRDIDVASEYVFGIRDDRFVGLQPYAAAQADRIADLPDSLYTSGPVYYEFRETSEPADFFERFCLKFLPWFYTNNPNGTSDPQTLMDGADICMPALWCNEPTLIAYSKEGYANKTWTLPPDWKGIGKVALSTITADGGRPEGDVPVVDGRITLGLNAGKAVMMTRQGG